MPGRPHTTPPQSRGFPVGAMTALLLLIMLAVLLASDGGCAGMAGMGPSQPTPMELQGNWLGMRLSAVDSSTAQELGIPPNVRGVVVAEVIPGESTRARQAGISAGDVIVSVGNNPVTSLTDLYGVTTQMDVNGPLEIRLMRRGQPLVASLAADATAAGAPGGSAAATQPAMAGASAAPNAGFGANGPSQMAAMPTPQAPMGNPTPQAPMGNPAMSPSAAPVMATQPMVPANAAGAGMAPPGAAGAMPMQQAAPGMGAPQQAHAHFYCPIDGVFWNANQVAPGFRCPRCGGALTQ